MNAQNKEDLSRRDDLESLGYILVYFMLGKLPWQNVKVDKPWQKKDKISEIMLSTPIATLCENLPKEFELYINYCRRLKFKDHPDYAYLRSIFQMMIKGSCITHDDVSYFNSQKEIPAKGSKMRDRTLQKAIHNFNENTIDSPQNVTVLKLADVNL